ncbi:MAG: MarR family transcriptional regulator [Acidimicrobiia bacterium]
MSTTQREKAARWEVSELRADYLVALERMGNAAQQVHDALDAAAAGLSVVRDQLQADGRASDLVNTIDPKPLRIALSGALTELERSRHAAQKLLFRILFAEGTNMSDIARYWGISRQLVSRLINEPD